MSSPGAFHPLARRGHRQKETTEVARPASSHCVQERFGHSVFWFLYPPGCSATAAGAASDAPPPGSLRLFAARQRILHPRRRDFAGASRFGLRADERHTLRRGLEPCRPGCETDAAGYDGQRCDSRQDESLPQSRPWRAARRAGQGREAFRRFSPEEIPSCGDAVRLAAGQ